MLLLADLVMLLQFLLLIAMVLLWVLPPGQPLVRALRRLTDPLLAPFRRLLPKTGAIDLSPAVLLILLEILRRLLISAAY